jgi:hypothetical protein
MPKFTFYEPTNIDEFHFPTHKYEVVFIPGSHCSLWARYHLDDPEADRQFEEAMDRERIFYLEREHPLYVENDDGTFTRTKRLETLNYEKERKAHREISEPGGSKCLNLMKIL